MRRIACAARLVVAASAVMLLIASVKAGAAGVYENAASEPAFLLSPHRVTLSADLDFSHNDPIEAAVYRVGATFPLRSVFVAGVEQGFVSVSDTSDIKSGIGDLTVRGSVRALSRSHRAILLLGYLATGTTKQEYFPYSSKTFDISTSIAYVDTLGDATIYATGGRTWINRSDEERPVDTRHNDYWRGSAGVAVGGGDVRVGGGTLYEYTVDHAERWMWYGAVSVVASRELVLRASAQFETGSEAQRVSDWAGSLGFTVRF
jgi:hypothetical protein